MGGKGRMKSCVHGVVLWVCAAGYETRLLSKSANSLHRKFGFSVVACKT